MKLPSFVRDLSLPPVEYHQQLRQWSKEMRATSPIIWDDESANWLVFRYDDVLRVQSDYRVFSSENTVSPASRREGTSTSIIEMDPPIHQKRRSLVTPVFSARTIAGMEPQVTQIVDYLLDGIRARGSCDWVKEMANPLPVMVIANMLGLPIEEWQQFKAWTDAIISNGPEQQEANELFRERFIQVIEKRAQEPDSDILSMLLTSEVDGERLSFEDILSFCFTLFIAGNITTTSVLGNAMLCFDANPQEWERLRQQPELVPTAVEEVIRYMPPFRAGPNDLIQGRVVKSDVYLSGQHVRVGEQVQVNRLSANFDEEHFPDPERFDVGRASNRHQSFGHGVHFCLGAPLARLEVRVAFERMLQKFRQFQLVPGVPLQQAQNNLLFGVQSLPVTFEAV